MHKWTRAAAAACGAILLASMSIVADARTSFGISGYEVFPGVTIGDTHYGVEFAGWTNAPSPSWVPYPGDGGSWATSVSYTGSAGIGSSATVVGGSWVRRTADGQTMSGRVVGGTVTWPASLDADIGCGAGVATFEIAISRGGNPHPKGSIVGCLDDTHLSTVFPPRIWGVAMLN